MAAPTIGAGNHGTYEYDTQGLVFSVYEDKIIMRARLFGERRFVGGETACGEVEIKLR